MTISLTNIGKRFNREWIFRHLDYQFTSGTNYAITGPNGSGKSTLLQVIAGATAVSEGVLEYDFSTKANITVDNVYKHFAIAAPYLELIEEMTLTEFLQFHFGFKPLLKGVDLKTTIAAVGLTAATDKQIRFFSSGMKQRVKLIQAVFSDVPLLLLDEPCTNLDAEGVSVYQQMISQYASNKLILVSSNDEAEYIFCKAKINMFDFKRF